MLVVAIMLFALTSGSSLARARVPEALLFAVPLLRFVTFPVLLPTRFDGFDLDLTRSLVKGSATSHHYELEMGLDPGCQGQNVCSAGSFYASDGVYRRAHPEIYARPETPASMRQRKAEERRDILSGRLFSIDRCGWLAA